MVATALGSWIVAGFALSIVLSALVQSIPSLLEPLESMYLPLKVGITFWGYKAVIKRVASSSDLEEEEAGDDEAEVEPERAAEERDIRCSSCGAVVLLEHNFCASCGQPSPTLRGGDDDNPYRSP